MPSSVLSTYNCDKKSQAIHRNHVEANRPPCGRFSPVKQLHGHVRTPPTPRRFTPGCAKSVSAEHCSDARTTKQNPHFRPAPDGQALTSPTPKRKELNKSSNNVSIDVSPHHALPPQFRRDGRGLSPVPLFKRSSPSTSSLGSVTSTEECSDDHHRLYIAPGRLSPLPALDTKRERQRQFSGNIPSSSSHHSSTPPPPPPKKSASTSNIRQFHSPQPPRKPTMGQRAAMTPPLTRRDHLPPPLVLTPPVGTPLTESSSPINSPGPPLRLAPLPPAEISASSNRRLSPVPTPSSQDPSSPKLPPKPAHLKSSPATSPRRSPVPFQFSYTPPASPGVLSSRGDSSPPIVPVREVKLCRAPLPPPPVTSQPRMSRAPIPPPKPDDMRRPTLDIPNETRHSKQTRHVRIVKVKHKGTKSHHHAKRDQRPRRSSKRNGYSQKVVVKKKKDDEEKDESCCGTCLRDCIADLPEYLLDFFC